MDQQVKDKRDRSLITPPPAAEAFYSEVLGKMAESGIPFLVSGTYALASYTGPMSSEMIQPSSVSSTAS